VGSKEQEKGRRETEEQRTGKEAGSKEQKEHKSREWEARRRRKEVGSRRSMRAGSGKQGEGGRQ
jgi:hypothetical protein